MKPSFVAPSQPLEKSLKEHIQRTAGLADWETSKTEKPKKGHKKDKQQSSMKKGHQGIKEPSPPPAEARTTTTTSSSIYEASSSSTIISARFHDVIAPISVLAVEANSSLEAFASLPKLTGLSVGQEPSEDASFLNSAEG